MEPTEAEIWLLTQQESISREAAIQLLKDFDSKKLFEKKCDKQQKNENFLDIQNIIIN